MTDSKANPDLKFVTTADGSNTLFHELIGEQYHSRHGAVQESLHVFLNSGLKFFLDRTKQKGVSILEIGFGTGLNFLLSSDYCRQQQIPLYYTGVEAYPLSEDVIFSTGYEKYVLPETWDALREIYAGALNRVQHPDEYSYLEIPVTTLREFSSGRFYDVLYFDAFAAVHQPEMWTADALQQCTRYLKKGGVFVTYAITGNLKRIMKSLNFSIEKAPGAPGKREMLRAIKQD